MTSIQEVLQQPEQHEVLAQLLDSARRLGVRVCIKVLGEGVQGAQLGQNLRVRLQPLVAASHRLSTL